jgi:hypothetical protein
LQLKLVAREKQRLVDHIVERQQGLLGRLSRSDVADARDDFAGTLRVRHDVA